MTKHQYNYWVALGSFLAILAIVVLVALTTHCSVPPKVADGATCSPKADAWHQVSLAEACAGKIVPDECPEAEELWERYLELEASECSSKP